MFLLLLFLNFFLDLKSLLLELLFDFLNLLVISFGLLSDMSVMSFDISLFLFIVKFVRSIFRLKFLSVFFDIEIFILYIEYGFKKKKF